MMFKVGDEVLVKAEVTDVSDCSEKPYFVAPDCRGINWVSEDKIIPMDKTYADGLNDAWELVKKIYTLEPDERKKMLGYQSMKAILEDLSAEYVADAIEAYEKEKEIKVGDVVRYGIGEDIGKYAIVMRIEGNEFYTMYADGSCGRETHTEDFKKTGKHIGIEELLKQIGE